MSARTDFPGQIVAVKLNGTIIRQEPVLFSHHKFSEARIPLELKAGDNEVELDYTRWHTEPQVARPMGVLFQHLHIFPQDGAEKK
jgi:hypothetical protein